VVDSLGTFYGRRWSRRNMKLESGNHIRIWLKAEEKQKEMHRDGRPQDYSNRYWLLVRSPRKTKHVTVGFPKTRFSFVYNKVLIEGSWWNAPSACSGKNAI